MHTDPGQADPTAPFRAFLTRWLEASGWSQYQLGLETGIRQGNVSRWLSPDPRRRTQPTHETLVKLAPLVGRSVADLMRMAGRLDEEADQKPEVEEDPPELAALIQAIRAAFPATDPTLRPERLRLTRVVWDIQQSRRGKERRPRDKERRSYRPRAGSQAGRAALRRLPYRWRSSDRRPR